VTKNKINELPPNYEELKKSANRTSNWRERFDAVIALGEYKNEKVIDVLKNRMNNDAVTKIREVSYRKLKELGEDVQMPPEKIGDPIKDTKKIMVRIKKSLPRDHTFEEFKDKLKKMRLDLYDTYEGEKGADFEKWLEQTWSELRTRS